MAFVQRDPSGNFHLCFRFGGRRFKRSLHTKHQRKADAAASHVEENIRLVGEGLLELPSDVDVPTFLLSDGKLAEKPKVASNVSDPNNLRWQTRLYSQHCWSRGDRCLDRVRIRDVQISFPLCSAEKCGTTTDLLTPLDKVLLWSACFWCRGHVRSVPGVSRDAAARS